LFGNGFLSQLDNLARKRVFSLNFHVPGPDGPRDSQERVLQNYLAQRAPKLNRTG
jgi:hypothetical protein